MPNLMSGIYSNEELFQHFVNPNSNANGTAADSDVNLDAIFSEMDSVYQSERRKQGLTERPEESQNGESNIYADIKTAKMGDKTS